MKRLVETIKISLATIVVAGLFFSFFGCKDDSSGIGTETNNNGDGGGLTITAEVEDGNDYNHLVDKVRAIMYRGGETIIIAECGFKDGSFELKLPEEVGNNRLYDFEDLYDLSDESMSISNSVMFNWISLEAHKDGENVGTFNYLNQTSTAQANSEYWYVNSDVSIKVSNEGDTWAHTWDLPLKKGWNELFSEVSETNSGFKTFSLSLKEPSGLKWQLEFTGSGDLIENKIIAKVENGNIYNGYITEVWGIVTDYDNLNEFVVSKGKYSNGGFTIELPSTVDGGYLLRIEEFFDYYFTISDLSTKMGILYIDAYNANGKFIGVFDRLFFEEKENQTGFSSNTIYSIIIYVDKDVSVNGHSVDSNWDYTWDVTANLSLKKGWNEIFSIRDYTYNNGLATDIVLLTSTKQSGLKWYFDDWGKKSTTKTIERNIHLEKFKNSSSFIGKLLK
ncbi:MAG: hypothetical protein FWH18_12210 [Marinilabiliaceae bacterium]|nr:hypothetical protein [Marinilabiliaceae bacterium]